MLRLTAFACSLLLAAAQDPADSVRGLIERLGSDDIAVREDAAKQLTLIGHAALPALSDAVAKSSGKKKELLDLVLGRIEAFGAPVNVTMDAKGRPLREIVADLERQTRIPFRLVGAAAEAKSNVFVKETVIWKVIEDICRARGDLMYRFIDNSVEIYPSKFRDLPAVDGAGFRFFFDRFICEVITKERGRFRMHAGVLAPAGARVILIDFKVDHLLDDQGNDLASIPEGWRWGVADTQSQQSSNPQKCLYPLGYLPDARGAPSLLAGKLTRCSGKVTVWLEGGERVLASIPNLFDKAAVPVRPELPALGITRWRRNEGQVQVRLSAAWNQPSVNFLHHWLSPSVKVRFKDGSRMSGAGWHSFPGIGLNEIKREDRIVAFQPPEGTEVAALDLVAPDPVLKVELPFDFRDIPLSAEFERRDPKPPPDEPSGRVGCRRRKVIDFSGTPTWTAIVGLPSKDFYVGNTVLIKDLKVVEAARMGGREFKVASLEDTAMPGFETCSPSGSPGPLEVALKFPEEGHGVISVLRLSMVARIARERRSYVLTPETMKIGDEHFDVSIRDADREWGGGSPEIEVRPKKVPHSELAGIWCSLLYQYEAGKGAPGSGGLLFTGKGEFTRSWIPMGSMHPWVMQNGEKVRRLDRVEVIVPNDFEDRLWTSEFRNIPLR